MSCIPADKPQPGDSGTAWCIPATTPGMTPAPAGSPPAAAWVTKPTIWEGTCAAANKPATKFDCSWPPMSCSHASTPATGGKSVELIVYSKKGGWATLPSADGTGGVVGKEGVNFMYVDPADPTAVKKATGLGMHPPWGCMFANAKATPPAAATGAAASSSNPMSKSSTQSGGTCSSAVMKSLDSTCDKIAKATPKQAENACALMQKQKQDFQAKLAKLQADEPWYKTLVTEAGGAVDNITSGAVFSNFVKAIGHAVGTNNKSIQKLNNALNINIDINQSQQAVSMCLNNVTSNQSNVASIMTCDDPYPALIAAVCGSVGCPPGRKNIAGPGKPMTCVADPLNPSTPSSVGLYTAVLDAHTKCISSTGAMRQTQELLAAQKAFLSRRASTNSNINISQTSKAVQHQACSQDLAQKAMTNFAAGISNEIAQQLMQKAKGMGASNTSEQDTCNDINVNMSACNYQSTQACCSNTATNNQTNNAEIQIGCSPLNANIKQSLNNLSEQMCNQSVKQSQEAKGTAQIKNKLAQAASQTAIGMNPFMIFIIIAIIIGIIILSPMALVFVLGTKIFLIMGIVIMLIGACQFPMYFASRYTGGCRLNKPFVFTARKDAPLASMRRDTYASAKKNYENSADIAAFDFFPDCLAMPDYDSSTNCKNITEGYKSYPNAIPDGAANYKYPDNTPGLAMYYKSISKSVNEGVECTQRGPLPAASGTADEPKTPMQCDVTSFTYASPPASTTPGGDTPAFVPGSSCPIFKGEKACLASAAVPSPSVCKPQNSQSCLTPSISYVKSSKQTSWLWSAIITTVFGIMFLGIGIWLQTSGKSHQRPAAWNKNKTSPDAAGGETPKQKPPTSGFNTRRKASKEPVRMRYKY